jgi:hypothetical protein
VTTPGDGFEYTDDSVIAKVSFDVPSSTVSDITQITQVMGAMRTQLEAIARAQSDWLDYLQQVPQIAERANQAFRDQITLMERMSYLQSEIGPAGMMGGGGPGYGGMRVGGGVGANAGGSGGGYTTAAPPGYVAPFKDGAEGTGQGPNLNALAEQIGSMTGDQARAAEEVLAARGTAINPAHAAMAAGVAARMIGGGGGAPGTGQTGRLGQAMQYGTQAATRIRDEIQNMANNGGRVGDLLGRIPGINPPGTAPSGPGGPGGPPGGPPPGPAGSPPSGDPNWLARLIPAGARSAYNALPPGAKGPLKAGAGIALGAMAFNKVQDIGERVTEYQQLGSQEGGDYATGFKRDMEARFQAIDPFIDTRQARESIALPMRAGFQGESRNDLRELLQSNFKELGVSFAQTMAMQDVNLRGQSLDDATVKKSNDQQSAALNVLKEMAGDGGNTMALQERTDQLQQMQAILNGLGISQDSATRSAIATQAGFDDSLALRKDGARITGQTMGSGTLMAMVGQKNGITGYLPNALPAALEEAGIDSNEATEQAAAQVAKMVSGLPKKLNRIAAFQSMMGEQGVDLDWPQAKDLYEKVSGDKDSKGRRKQKPTERAASRISQLGEDNKQSNWNPLTGIADTLAPILNAKSLDDFRNLPGDIADGFAGRHKPSENARQISDLFKSQGRPADEFAPAGQQGRSLPQSMKESWNNMTANLRADGKVTGNVTITVNQDGRVTAPPTIQLTGTTKAVNSGKGGSTLNSASSTDFAANTLPGGR